MKKQYYVRYYQTYTRKQSLEKFLQAIASCGLKLHNVLQREIKGYDGEKELEYTTIWEIDAVADYLLLDGEINRALASKQYNYK
jgi:hypothetical protein